MGRSTPDPRKKRWKDPAPPSHRGKTVFGPLSESALKAVSDDVIHNKLKELDEVEDANKKYRDISATPEGRAKGVKGTGPQKFQLEGFRKVLKDELERRACVRGDAERLQGGDLM
jgi:hypothetical protein